MLWFVRILVGGEHPLYPALPTYRLSYFHLSLQHSEGAHEFGYRGRRQGLENRCV